jgi:hypothetical protein
MWDNNSRNDIIKPYPKPTQNSEEPSEGLGPVPSIPGNCIQHLHQRPRISGIPHVLPLAGKRSVDCPSADD